MYINLHTKSHIFLKKIGIFCNKIITFSSSAHLMKKSTFLPKFQFFSHKINIFAPKLDIDRNTCNFASKFTRHYFITGLGNSLICPKTDDFCIKMLFFTKRKQRHQKLTISETEDISLRKLKISIKKHFWKWGPSLLKTDIFENGDHLLQKWENPSKLVFLQDFRFYQWSSHNKKINTSKTNCHFSSELTTKILLKSSVIFP